VLDYASLFYTTLALTIGFSLFELAVELLRIESLNEVVALVAVTAMWTTLACAAQRFSSAVPGRGVEPAPLLYSAIFHL
jgi:hypothetical protein